MDRTKGKAASTVAWAALALVLGACTHGRVVGSTHSDSRRALGSAVLSPAPPPCSQHSCGLSACPVGIMTGSLAIGPSELSDAMSGYLPKWLPTGFGLVGA